MPTNSDLKRWYKVYSIEQKDFVRYDAMFRIFCYDAIDDFHAVNLGQMNEAIKKAIQEHVYDINIENGDGEYSLQQKTSDKSNKALAYLSKVGGSQSIVKPNDSDKNATGEGSCANGYDIQIDGAKYAYAGGQHVRVEKDANNSFAYGDNLVTEANSQAVFGKYNVADDVSLFMIGAGTDEEHRKTIMRALSNGQVLFSEAPVNLEAPIRLKDFTIDYYPASKVETAKLALKANDFTDDGTIAAFLKSKVDKLTGNNVVYSTDAKGEQSQLSYSADAIANTIVQRTMAGRLKAADGAADNDLATIKQLNIVKQGNYSNITNIDLNTDNTTIEYNATSGIAVNATGTITHENGNTDQPTTMFKVPIVAGDDIVIDKAQNEEKVNIKVNGKVTKTPNSIAKRDNEGHVKTADATSDEDATSYGQHKALRTYTDSELLKKFDKTGGTIIGNVIVSGNLSVSGETSVIESTTLKVIDKLIYVAKDNTSALTSPAGLITPKYDGTNDGGLVYDNSGTAYVGDITLDSNGNVDVNNSDLQPIATRDAYNNFTNGHKVKAEIDASQKSVKFIDGGKDDGINSLTNADLTFADITVLYNATSGIQLTSTGRFTYTDGTHDATIDLDLPIIGTNGIVIDKVADSEKIEVSGKNLIKDPYPGVNDTGASIVNYKPNDASNWGSAFVRNTHNLVMHAESAAIVGYDNNGVIYAKTTSDDPWSVVNKEYAEAHYRQLVTGAKNEIKVYVTKYGDTDSWMFLNTDPDGTPGAEIPQYGTGGTLRANMPTTPLDNSVVNKKYAEDHFTPAYSSSLPVLWGGELICYNNETYGRCSLDVGTASYTAVLRDAGGQINLPEIPANDYNAICKKYAEDHYRQALETEVGQWKIYASINGDSNGYLWAGPEVLADIAVVVRGNNGCIYTNMPDAANTKDTTVPNKKYIDDAIKEKTLYRHDLRIVRAVASSVFGYSVYCSFYSSSNLSISSLTDLKTVLGNTFTIMATGYLSETYANYDPVMAILQSGIRPIKNIDQTYDNATFSDSVTKII